MRVAIIGTTGLLGNAIYKVLKDKCALVLTARSQDQFDLLEKIHGGTVKHKKIIFNAVHPTIPHRYQTQQLAKSIGKVDMVINCIGVLNKFHPGMTPTPREYYAINTELPIYLSEIYGPKLIHPSTDCVFDGMHGPYTEKSAYCPSYGIYGYSKLFADEVVKEASSVFRCCLIGDELREDAFQLFSWIKQQKTIGGYTDWTITPITGIEFGKMCFRILEEDINLAPGVLHLATDPVSKYDILCKYKELHGLDVEITKDNSVQLNKVLGTIYPDALIKLKIASFEHMMADL